MVGILIGLYLGLLLFTSLPASQRWLTQTASDLLTKELGCGVTIGQVHIGLFNRVVMDDLCLLDQQSDTLLASTRLSAKLNLWQLIQGRVRIHHIQLFGYDIRLHRSTADAPYNFQFLIDRFSSEDEEPSALDLAISSILIRRGTLTLDTDDAPTSDTFTPHHIHLKDLSLRASIDALTDSTYSIGIKQLSLVDTNSGFILRNLQVHLSGQGLRHTLTDFTLQLPQSTLRIPSMELVAEQPHFWTNGYAKCQIEGSITPADFSSFYLPLREYSQSIQLSLEATFANQALQVHSFTLDSDGLDANMEAIIPADSTGLVIQKIQQLDIQKLSLSAPFSTHLLSSLSSQGHPAILPVAWAEKLSKLGSLQVFGHLASPDGQPLLAEATIQSDLGRASLHGTLKQGDHFQVDVETEDIRLSELLGEEIPLDHLNLRLTAEGSLREQTTQVQLTAKDLVVKGEKIETFHADLHYSPTQLTANAQAIDPQYSFKLDADLKSPEKLVLHADELHTMQGQVTLSDVSIHTPTLDYDLHQLTLYADHIKDKQSINLSGDFISANINGNFSFNELTQQAQQMLHAALPSLIPPSEQLQALATKDDTNHQRADFDIYIWEMQPLLQLFQTDIDIPRSGHLKGHIDTERRDLALTLHLPHLIYNDHDLRNVHLTIQEKTDTLNASLSLRRIEDEAPVDLSLLASGSQDMLTSLLEWDNHDTPAMQGELSAIARFHRDDHQKLGAHIQLRPSRVVVSDTIWNVHASTLQLYEKAVDIHQLQVSQMGRQLVVNGRISAEPDDTLRADLQGINLEYVFGLIGFDDVDFAGKATGRVVARHLLDAPRIDARLRVNDFSVNGGHLGEMQVTGGFGRRDVNAIDLDAFITEPVKHQISHIQGLIKPGHEPGRGLDLDVQAHHLSIEFLNDFTDSFLTDLVGNATGHAHLYGPFKALDLEGDLVLDTVAVSLDYLGHRYHSLGGDSVHLRPGRLYTNGLALYDRHHRPSRNDHRATLRGEVQWKHFKDIHYAFDVAANGILGYDFRDFGDEVFHGTVFGNGNIHIAGTPGSITIDIQGSPAPGSSFTYNATTPETLTDNAFITFVDHKAKKTDDDSIARTPFHPSFIDDRTDLRLNFDLNVTPNAAIRLLMDARSDDYITLYGNGHLRASYYNKGRFQMYGTYRVDHGNYRLTLQDVLHKDFQFEQGGTITFGGTPMNADLNLRAIYTLPSVSLNELATGTNFSESNVRVNCLMNISGQAHAPQVTFDFDIPNVNEDVKQMVRSLISTDEERNMQVIYLLGIGRFYTYEYNNPEQSQTNTAMNGLLSSTLSGQLSDMLSNTIGNRNWNFGTNLSTGTMGWSDMDVEGMLSGRLLNNRLIINGTFGYRDTPVSNTNFIGDFDVQWLLTPSGGFSLKAYSETNDRYFTKTALTTQGIGLQVKRDFNHFSELFRRKKRTEGKE